MKKYSIFWLVAVVFIAFACDSPIPTTASFTVSPSEAPLGSLITFDAGSSNGAITSFAWTFGDGTFGNGQMVNHIYAEAKKFTVTLTVSDSEGGTKTSSSTVSIYREGFQMSLVPLRTAPLGVPELWIDSISSQNPKTGTAWIAISELAFDEIYITENHIFTLTLPGDLVEFTGNYQLTERALQYQYDGAAIILNTHPNVAFKVFFCVGEASSQFLLVELRMKSAGTGTIDIKAKNGISCYLLTAFKVEAFPASITLTPIHYYDD